MFKKLLLTSVLSLGVVSITNWAYESVDCSINQTFWQYSCNECFNWWVVKEWDVLSFLDDIWYNKWQNKKIIYKEEQKMPVLTPLNWASFSKRPDNDTFWEYTSEFEALKNAEFDWYVLPIWQNVSWLKSSMGAWYKVDKIWSESSAAWILVFDIADHDILSTWEIDMSEKVHKECVLYKAWAWKASTPIIEETPPKKEPEPKKEEMTKVKTWPEMYFLIIIMSFVMWLVLTNRNFILEKIRK